MAAAAHLRISHKRFLGWLPKNGESEWDHEQRALMIAHFRVERNAGQYGEWLPDATSERADPNNYDDPLRYYTHGPFINQAVKAAEDVRDAYRREAGEKANMNGMFWTVDTEPDEFSSSDAPEP